MRNKVTIFSLVVLLAILFPMDVLAVPTSYLGIKDNIVVLSAAFDSDNIPADLSPWGIQELVERGDDGPAAGIGWIYTAPDRFDNPAPTVGYSEEYIIAGVLTRVVSLSYSREDKITELEEAFETYLSQGVLCSVSGTDYFMAATLDDVMLLDGGIRLAQKLLQTDMTITDFYGVDHVVSLADADAINLIQAGHFATQRQRLNDLRNQSSAATLEELPSIVW